MSMPLPAGAFRWPTTLVLLVLLAAVLAGCASGPPRGASTVGAPTTRPSPDRDGAEANPPPDLAQVPDAEPRLEPIRSGGPNKPYAVLGRDYTPITKDAPFTERGLASWYGRKFHGRRTASGEVYNMYAMTAAHPTLPIPSYARVRNPANGREVVLRINDRGPFHPGRIVDLSYTAALKLDLLRGVGPVELQRITFDDIRSGAWRRDGEPVRLAEANPSAPPSPVVTVAPAVIEPEVAAAPTGVAPSAAAPTPSADTSPVADAPAARAYTQPARGFWVQLGAFKQRDGAEGFHKRVSTEADWLAPLLAVFSDASVFRLQAGPYPSRDEARGVAERVRLALQLVPVIVERK
jgi:rare lipoprotein A